MQHDTPEYLAALQEELRQAEQLHAGGQTVDEGRVAAIQDEIARCEAALADNEPESEPKVEEVTPEPELETADATDKLEDTNGPKTT